MTGEMVDEGYTHDPSGNHCLDSDQDDNNPQSCVIPSFKSLLSAGVNLWITTRGNEDFICIEVYNSESARNQRYTYLGEWYETWEIGNATADSKYCITALPGGIESWSNPSKQIYFLGACYSETLLDDLCGGLQLGYHGDSTGSDDQTNADILFKNMSGRRHSGAKRRSEVALVDCPTDDYTNNLRHSGFIENDTVLAPAVTDWFPKERACPDIQGWVEFDCTMDTSHEDLILGSGCVNVDLDSVQWANDHKVTFDFTAGEGDVVEMLVDAEKAVSANNHDIELDGNLNPEDTNAVAPNRTLTGEHEDFVWTVPCDCDGCNGGDAYTIHYECGVCECNFELLRNGCDWEESEPVAGPCPSCANVGTPFCYHQADVWYEDGYWYARVWTNASFRCTVTFDCTFRMENTTCCPAGAYTYYSGSGCCPEGSLWID